MGLDIILPPRCPVNGTIVHKNGAISPEAWRALTFITPPLCYCCGMPFGVAFPDDKSPTDTLLCGDCLTTPRPYSKARSLFAYDEGSRPMILAFKHGDALHIQTTLLPLLKNIAEEFLDENTVLIPVPLHWMRLIKRRYNQAAILSNGLAALTHHESWADALWRKRHTPPQGHMNAKDRHDNVKHAFTMNPKYTERVKGKKIILLDDVLTTGATIEECAKILKEAGAAEINILTVSRVVKSA